MALIDKLSAIADSIRAKTGLTGKLTLDQMVQNVDGIDVMPETVILVDEDGNELPAVFTDETVELTATANDIRKGCVAVNGDGIVVGEKRIPSYETEEGVAVIPAGGNFSITSSYYDYTKLQAIICVFNTSLSDSTASEKVVISNNVYAVSSTDIVSSLTKDDDSMSVNLGITNNSDSIRLIRYFMYKEEY